MISGFPSFIIESISWAMNRLVNGILIHWPCAMNMAANNVFDPLSLAKCLVLITCCVIFGGDQISTSNAMELKEITKIKIYSVMFISMWHVFILSQDQCHYQRVWVTQHAFGDKTMNSFGTDLISGLTIWLVGRVSWVNLFAYHGRMETHEYVIITKLTFWCVLCCC